jgi:site-specific recombinase XerD
VRLFAEKLQSKNQTLKQQEQAADAVSIFFALQKDNKPLTSTDARRTTSASNLPQSAPNAKASAASNASTMVCEPPASSRFCPPPRRGGKHYDEWRCLRKTDSPAWDAVIEKLAAEIKLRHYSRNTLKHYADWSRKFQSYLKNKPPEALSPSEVKAYLTYLAVNCKVSSSHQNLAFNSLLFLYRHVLNKDFGIHKDIPRAKKTKGIPMVLSRREIDEVLKHLSHPYKLVAQLQYGCGLRINEGVSLRIKDFNFDTGLLTVRGKGEKTRTVPIPKMITPELQAQVEAVKKLHDVDLTAGYARKAKLTKRVTSHTFRHSYATAMLQAGYDLRTIQTLLGHADIRTTMIYLHCLPGKTEKEVKSPLDF